MMMKMKKMKMNKMKMNKMKKMKMKMKKFSSVSLLQTGCPKLEMSGIAPPSKRRMGRCFMNDITKRVYFCMFYK